MTHVLVLGGSGRVGAAAAARAATASGVERVTVAGRSRAAAEAIAAGLGAVGAAACAELDDRAALNALLREADVVLNAVAPYFRHGAAVLDAAIAAGCHYLDVCDDWQPIGALLARDASASAAGVTATIGLGLAPGISSQLARLAASELDEFESVTVGFDLRAAPAPAPRASGDLALIHLMECCRGALPQRTGGSATWRPALEEVCVSWPSGARRAWRVGSPEALTLPLVLDAPEVRTVVVADEGVIDGLRIAASAVDDGYATHEQIAQLLAEAPNELPPTGMPAVFAVAEGGGGHRVAAWWTRALDLAAAGEVLGGAVPWLLEGELGGAGVRSVEQAMAPKAYLDAVAELLGATGSGADGRRAYELQRFA